MKIQIPGHNLYLVLHTHEHGTSYHHFAVPEGQIPSRQNLAEFLEEYDESTDRLLITMPITIDDVRVLDLNDKETP